MAPPRVPAFRPDQLWQHAREPMFWLDSGLRVIWVNKAWEMLTGVMSESVVGLVCAAHAPTLPGEPADLAASFSPPPESVAGQPSGSLTLILRADGERLWRRVDYWPVVGQDDALLGILGQVRESGTAPGVPDSRANAMRVRLMELRDRLHRSRGVEVLIGTGPAHERLREQVRLAAASRSPILLVGEPGTGKRLVARMIHQSGPDRDRPLIPIDCQALPAEVLGRELFGAGRRFAEDAERRHEAAIEGASPPPRPSPGEGSDLVIGDVLSLPRDLQSRLVDTLNGPVRVYATTAGDPEAALDDERLLPEFYYAITVVVIRLEPLRRRRQDLPLLAQHLLERANQRVGSVCGGFTSEAAAAIAAYDWPGNLRELARVVDFAHGRAEARVRTRPSTQPRSTSVGSNGLNLIGVDDLPASILGNLGAAYLPPPPAPLKPLDDLLTEIERRLIDDALSRARRNKSRAAEILGISRPRLYRRIKELNLPDDSEPDAADLGANGAESIDSGP